MPTADALQDRLGPTESTHNGHTLTSGFLESSTGAFVSNRVFSPDPGVEITEHPVPLDIWETLLRLNPFERP